MTTRWIINQAYLQNILAAAPDVAPLFDGTGSWMLCTPTVAPPSVSVSIAPVGNYKSFAQAQADSINSNFKWLLYDPEDWSFTPAAEQQDPRQYTQRFGQWAHHNGYQVIMAPARDLANTDTVKPKNPGERLDDWYLRTSLASDGARHADVFSIQSQADTILDLPSYTTFDNFVTGANNDAKSLSGNPYCNRLAGVSTNYGTAAQMAAAAKSVSSLVGGFWLNVPDNDTSKAVAFLRLMQ